MIITTKSLKQDIDASSIIITEKDTKYSDYWISNKGSKEIILDSIAVLRIDPEANECYTYMAFYEINN